jgi:EAL domain-containing protein (putative c-di-GMP-specific phosphodiesterase class I)
MDGRPEAGTRAPVGLDRVSALVQRHLELDLVYVTEVRDGVLVLRAWAGDAAPAAAAVGAELPAQGTYSRLLLDGTLPGVIPDTGSQRGGADVPTVRGGVGAFLGVPLRLSDGSLYGTLCGIKHRPDHSLGARDERFMRMLAELVVGDLDEQRRVETLSGGLSDLIEGERVDIACQPIVHLPSGRCIGVEALSRFPAPFSRPDLTFAAAGEVGLGLELERLAVRKAWELLPVLGGGQFLSINLSPGALVELAGRAIGRADLPLPSLVVEVTEHAVVARYDELRKVLTPLRELGLRIAVDDVGAGYASLHHVLELRPDFIKVDTSLVQGVADDSVLRATISSIEVMSSALGATIIAEGVETARDLAALRELGVQAAQGYLLGRPSTDREQLGGWLRQGAGGP